MRENVVTNRIYGKLEIEFAAAYLYFQKSGITQRILHQLKYGKNPDLGHLLGAWFGYALVEHGIRNEIDYIVPVPIHPKKERSRGYNQSLMIAQGISEATSIPVQCNVLRRKRYEQSQTQRSKEKRLHSVTEAFDLKNNHLIEGRHILLIDDVITTGATLEACGSILWSCGISKLSVAALALAK
ncbi:MAG: ComF family protein [Cyclobacteriaceae bacterium]|nr:ComF family protein [Cyclobacteriaceae bacterium]